MLNISVTQESDLSTIWRARYVTGLEKRLAERNPELAAAVDETDLRVAVEAAVAAAQAQGFTQRGPIRLYLDVCVAFGSGFKDDPMYPWAAEAIGSPDPDSQAERAAALFASSSAAADAINGPQDEWARAALAALLRWAQEGKQPARDQWLGQHVVGVLASLHPQKAAHAGEMALRSLVTNAARDCARHGSDSARAITLVSALKFTFGDGCLRDPIHGWIERTLTDQALADAAARFASLEQTMIIRLKTMLAGRQQKG